MEGLVDLGVGELAVGVEALEVVEAVVYHRICAEVGLNKVHHHQMTVLSQYEASLGAFRVVVCLEAVVLCVKLVHHTDTGHSLRSRLLCWYHVEVGLEVGLLLGNPWIICCSEAVVVEEGELHGALPLEEEVVGLVGLVSSEIEW